MKRTLLCILLATTIALPSAAAAGAVAAESAREAAAQEAEEITISLKGNTLHIQRAEGYTAEIYNITGVKVASYKVDSPEKTVTLNLEKGYYIVKVGKVARRILIR